MAKKQKLNPTAAKIIKKQKQILEAGGKKIVVTKVYKISPATAMKKAAAAVKAGQKRKQYTTVVKGKFGLEIRKTKDPKTKSPYCVCQPEFNYLFFSGLTLAEAKERLKEVEDKYRKSQKQLKLKL